MGHTEYEREKRKLAIAEVAIDLKQRQHHQHRGRGDSPITMLGKSKMSLRIEKQNVAGNGAPDGLSKTQCEYTALVVFSNACEAKFSQYSTTD